MTQRRLYPRKIALLFFMLPSTIWAFTGTGWNVGVIDTGIYKSFVNPDAYDPFLVGRTIKEKCYSVANYYTTRIDRRGNTQYDYSTGSTCRNGQFTDVSALTPSTNIGAVEPSGEVHNARHGDAHGSWVGRIVATTSSGANIQPVNVNSFFGPPVNGFGLRTQDIRDALNWMYFNRSELASVNLSLRNMDSSYCTNQTLSLEINALVNSGVAVIAATGNDSYEVDGGALPISWPGCLQNVISVAAVHNDTVEGYSNTWSGGAYGVLDFWAEGRAKTWAGGGISGTSFAAPKVAAAFAILKEAKPSATVAEMKAALKATGKRIVDNRNGVAAIRVNDATIQAAAKLLAKGSSGGDTGHVDDQIGYVDTGEYGPGYGDTQSPKYSFEIQFGSASAALVESPVEDAVRAAGEPIRLSTKRDLVLRFVGKSSLKIKVNGMERGSVHSASEQAFVRVLNRNYFRSGTNIVSIEPAFRSSSSWGVKNVSAEYAPQVKLRVGRGNNGKYGYDDPVKRYTGMRVNFDLSSVDTDLAFAVTGWDVDAVDETAVFLNDNHQGYLTKGESSAYNVGDRFVFRQAELVKGSNTIEFVQRRPDSSWSGYEDEKWAVKDMFLKELLPDLMVSSIRIVDKKLTANVPFKVSSQVSNVGEGFSGSTIVGYYLSLDRTIRTTDRQIGSMSLASMGEGQVMTQTITLSSSQVNNGFFIGACVKAVTNEINRNNNCSAGVQFRTQIDITPIIMFLMQ